MGPGSGFKIFFKIVQNVFHFYVGLDASILTNLLHRERLCRKGEPKGDGRCFQWNGQYHHTDIPQGKQRHLSESSVTGPRPSYI